MSSTTRNALHVVRLVLRQQSPTTYRRASTATASLARDADTTNQSASSSSSSSRINISHPTPSSDVSNPSFLESESDEYATASLQLPTRQLEPEPIPWPTLFRHSDTLPPQSKFCDPIYRLVSRGRYQDAMKIYQEILTHNQKVQNGILGGHSIRIQHRHEYLKPVLSSLKDGDFQSILLWLNIYPNRPATSNNPGLKKIWEPFIIEFLKLSNLNRRKFRRRELNDNFLEDFFNLIGKKGLLPILLPSIIPHLTFTFKPELSKNLLKKSLNSYWIFTTSNYKSNSDRAKFQEIFVKNQIQCWWGSYLRKLIIAGYRNEAKDLVENKPFEGEWDEFTQKIIREELEDEIPVEKDQKLRINDTETITRRIRSYLHDLPTPTELSTLIRALSHPLIAQEHPTLLNRFKSRFTNPPSIHIAKKLPTIQHKLWVHSEILNLQESGNHQGAIQLFNENFAWEGLPSSEKLSMGITLPENVYTIKSYPSIQIITTLIPSLIYGSTRSIKESLNNLYSSYISSIKHFQPSLKPNDITHAIFLREITHHNGSLAGMKAINELIEMGIEPGEYSYAAVLCALAGRRQIDHFWTLLDQAENENKVGQRTYRGIVAILIKTGLPKEAEKVFWRARQRLGREDLFDDLEV